MAKPVSAPAMEETIDGKIKRRPEDVALDRRTAWKYSGLDFPSKHSLLKTIKTRGLKSFQTSPERREVPETYILKRIELVSMAAMKLE